MKFLQHRYMPMALAGAAIAMLFVHLALGVFLLCVVGGVFVASHIYAREVEDKTKGGQLVCILYALLSVGIVAAHENLPEYSPELPLLIALPMLLLLAFAIKRKIISMGEATVCAVCAIFPFFIIGIGLFFGLINDLVFPSDMAVSIFLWLPRTFPEYTPIICLLLGLCVLVYCVRAVRRDKMEFLDAVVWIVCTFGIIVMWILDILVPGASS